MTLKDLSLLKLEHDALKYPNMPVKYIPLFKYTDKTANGLTRCIIDYLTLQGYQAERISTTGRMVDNTKNYTNVLGITKQIGSKKWIKGSGTKGSADISSTIPIRINGTIIGVSVKWEVKIGKDRQSDFQKEYQKNIEKNGGYYFIVKDFKDFIDKYLQLN
jgi:hypothetical protein